MSDNLPKYVPILRWKEAEMCALQELYRAERKVITPLLETFTDKNSSDQTSDYKDPKLQATDLYKRWHDGRAFIDLWPTVGLAHAPQPSTRSQNFSTLLFSWA